MSEFKVGDKFEIVKGMGEKCCEWGEKGTVITLVEQNSQLHAKFLYPSGKTWTYHFSDLRLLKTEAEKRGAKFGVGGVVNNTSAIKRKIGKKISFVGIDKNSRKEELWMCDVEGEDKITGFLPSSIRLDHEPEYREIPFSEATHEQRMDVSNLIHGGGAIVKEIYCFQNGGYAYTTSWAKTPSTALFRLTVRIIT